jgi:Tfp pilus assembly protein PilF
VQNFEMAAKSGGVNTIMKAAMGHSYAKMGRNAEATQILEDLITQTETQYVSPYTIATVYAGLNNVEKSIEWLQKAINSRSVWQIHLHFQSDPRFESIRQNASYKAILNK